ncbi:MAG: SAM-dependent methyltransferase [Gammaproteobacteria bacterium]|jgi:SAM-dependent MidA family methyltransferase|nr:SAM-dependent methyltransferase [Gammaproteobacteria bacterium]MDP6615647.1 SAM-dependent methyltransferase [Gammaproteobacteria bacterium]MDP6694674.1 SAM-dependent methyltransferase [Gammaproteobacteria bacterium]MDP7041217.1 SAM-dependent methyltransferase [Gammaproteobacteria bacterium]
MLTDLPEPDAEARVHSEKLRRHVQERIESAGGWISFADYMDMALYAPGLGYYSAGAAKFGEAGDFVTAPEISPLFSQCVAGQCAQVLGEAGGGDILELGAGSGAMAAEMLLELERLDCLPGHYLVLEPSADLRARQETNIRERAGSLADCVRWLDTAPAEPIRGVLVANEVADAIPVNRFVLEGPDSSEIGVALRNDKLRLEARPAGPELVQALEPVRALPGLAGNAPFQSEISLRLPAWLLTVSAWLEEGVALLFDYGFSRPEYYLPERSSGTLRCYYRHRAHNDPLFWPGLQDITAWVDFTLLAETARDAQLDVLGYSTQAHFLLAAGLDERVGRHVVETQQLRTEIAHGIRQLIMPGEMGESIKVLALGKGDVTVPEGMTGRDMRSSL